MGSGLCTKPSINSKADAEIDIENNNIKEEKNSKNNNNIEINIEEEEIKNNDKNNLKNSKIIKKNEIKIINNFYIKGNKSELLQKIMEKEKQIEHLKGIIKENEKLNKKNGGLINKDNNGQIKELIMERNDYKGKIINNNGDNKEAEKKKAIVKSNNSTQTDSDGKNKENELILKEKILLQKENELKKREKELNTKNNNNNKNKEKELTLKENKIMQKENEIKNKEKEIEMKKNNLIMKENELKNKQNNLISKENNLKQMEIQLINKQNELLKRELEFKKKEKMNKVVLIGLNNIGATCYMNATLQCLSNTKTLTEHFLTNYRKDSKKIMANEYYKVLKNLWDVDSVQKSYSPTSFKEVLSQENPLFAGIAANDSKDLINFLIERLHQELNNININNINNNIIIQQEVQTNELLMLKLFIEEFNQKFNSPISNLFYGILETKSQCQGCKIIKYNFQVYSFLEFPLQQVNQYYFNNGTRPLFTNDGKNPDVDLYECFEYYRKVDLMTGDNQMYCNICNKLCDSYYSTILYSGPLYLIINLNRGKGAVYECKVNFPSQINILNFLTFKNSITTYELYAVICHLGPSSMSGHFVAYCRNRIDNKWYLYNDAIVSPCTRKYQYNDGMPYILFYKAYVSD